MFLACIVLRIEMQGYPGIVLQMFDFERIRLAVYQK
jgi:hypothetical protein